MTTAPTRTSAKEFVEFFVPLFKAMPDLVGELKRWGETADRMFIRRR